MATVLRVDDILIYEDHWMNEAVQQHAVNRFCYKVTAVNGGMTLEASLPTFSAAVFAGMTKLVVGFHLGVAAYRISPDKTRLVIGNHDRVQNGADHELLPGQCCGIITRNTDTIGRTGRGRIYVPFPGKESSLGGRPTNDYFGDLAVLRGPMVGTFNIINEGGRNVSMVASLLNRPNYKGFWNVGKIYKLNDVVSFPDRIAPFTSRGWRSNDVGDNIGNRPGGDGGHWVILPSDGFTTTPITGIVPRKKWATQRKRGTYGKINVADPFAPPPG